VIEVLFDAVTSPLALIVRVGTVLPLPYAPGVPFTVARVVTRDPPGVVTSPDREGSAEAGMKVVGMYAEPFPTAICPAPGTVPLPVPPDAGATTPLIVICWNCGFSSHNCHARVM
jgi:hypothetical protein